MSSRGHGKQRKFAAGAGRERREALAEHTRTFSGTEERQPAGKQSISAARSEAWSQEDWLRALRPLLPAVPLALDELQCEQLAQYMVMLGEWNRTYNLTALRSPAEMLSHHLMDCLAVVPPLRRHVEGSTAPGRANGDLTGAAAGFRLLDVGSGGGLPGVVLAICCPSVHVTCVDAVGKKAAFVRQVGAVLRLPNLRALHSRVEDLKDRYDLITSRAFASLSDFVSLTGSLLERQGAWMAMKARAWESEAAGLSGAAEVFHVEHLSVPELEEERRLIWMRKPAQ